MVRYIPLVDTAVVVGEDGGDIDTIRARHTVVALVAGNGVEVVDVVRYLHQERILVGCDRAQGRIGMQVLAEVLHIGHTAQHGEYAFGVQSANYVASTAITLKKVAKLISAIEDAQNLANSQLQ